MDISEVKAEIRYLIKKLDAKLYASSWMAKSIDKIIVTSRAQTGKNGILYEQDACVVLPYSVSSHELGKTVLQALSQFKHEAKSLRDYKTSDWPSYRASKLRSARSFEETFIGIDVEAWENGMLHLVGMPKHSFDITVSGTLGGFDTDKLGDRLFQVALCCYHLRDNGLA